MLKKVLIGLGIAVVAAGLVVGVLYAINAMKSDEAAPDTTPKTVLDHSKDYGACTLLDTAAIKAALGEAASDLQAPQDMGIVANKALGDGVEDLTSDSQFCVYAFKPGGTLENGYNSGDALLIERIVYTNEGGPQSLIDQIIANGATAPVEELETTAFYSSNTVSTGPDATYSFRLETFTDNTSVRYMIRQPAASASFTAESAKAALIELAQQAKPPQE